MVSGELRVDETGWTGHWVNLSSSALILLHSGTEIQDLLLKQAAYVVPCHDRQEGFFSAYVLVQCITYKAVRILTIKRLLDLVQPGDCLILIHYPMKGKT